MMNYFIGHSIINKQLKAVKQIFSQRFIGPEKGRFMVIRVNLKKMGHGDGNERLQCMRD